MAAPIRQTSKTAVPPLPPGPKSNFFGLDLAFSFRSDPLSFAQKLHHDFGDVVLVKFGPINWIMLSHPDLVKEVLVNGARVYLKSEQFKRIITRVDGLGLVATEGDFWLRQRRTIQPTFGHDKLSGYCAVVSDIVQHYMRRFSSGMVIDVAQEMTNLTLSISAKLFLGIDVGGNEKSLGDAVTALSKAMYREFTEILPVSQSLPLPSTVAKRKALATIDKLCLKGIERQKQAPEGGTFLHSLLSACDTESGERMPEEQVLAEAKTMFNAGHDSTAAALAWSWYLLMTNAEVYDRLLDETKAQCDKTASLRPFQAPYALQIAKEALRLYPPAWLLPRQASQDTTIGGYAIPKGALVNMLPYIIQRSPRFFSNPETFNPDRFTPDNERTHHPFAWFPFGAGPRSCIGRDLALMEMQMIMTLISQKYRLELIAGQTPPGLNPLISLEPKNPILATLIPR